MNAFKTILVLALLAPSLALASGFEVINVNPRDLALSSSAVAAQQDAAATFGNPAALSKLEGLNLSIAGSLLSLKTKWSAPSGGTSGLTGTSTTKFAPTPPVAAYAAYGMKVGERGLGFGFGLGTPGGGQMRWDDDWQGRGRIITVERRMLGFYLNAGYEVMPWLRVGGGGVYYYGIQYLKQGIEPFQGAFGELSTKGGGFAFQLATEVQLLPNLTFGLDYKHKGTMSMKGDGHFEVPPALAGPGTQDQSVSQDLTFPNTLAAGFAWKPAKAAADAAVQLQPLPGLPDRHLRRRRRPGPHRAARLPRRQHRPRRRGVVHQRAADAPLRRHARLLRPAHQHPLADAAGLQHHRRLHRPDLGLPARPLAQRRGLLRRPRQADGQPGQRQRRLRLPRQLQDRRLDRVGRRGLEGRAVGPGRGRFAGRRCSGTGALRLGMGPSPPGRAVA